MRILPSRVAKDNEAGKTQEEEKKDAANAVAAGEDPAPANSMISGAPDDSLFLPAQPIRDL